MDVKWHNDQHAQLVHSLIKRELENMIKNVFPNHEFSHMGINRDDNTEEVIIKLHLNPIGRVRVVPGDEESASKRYPREFIAQEMAEVYRALGATPPRLK